MGIGGKDEQAKGKAFGIAQRVVVAPPFTGGGQYGRHKRFSSTLNADATFLRLARWERTGG